MLAGSIDLDLAAVAAMAACAASAIRRIAAVRLILREVVAMERLQRAEGTRGWSERRKKVPTAPATRNVFGPVGDGRAISGDERGKKRVPAMRQKCSSPAPGAGEAATPAARPRSCRVRLISTGR